MTLPIHDRSLPPYVHNLVVEAGRDSVFWASARDPGERPDTGGSMSEWRNRVVGSSQEATQSTASNQPIWRGGEVEFGGDDFFDLGSRSSIDKLTLWVAGDPSDTTDPGSDDYISYESSSNSTRIGARLADDLGKVDFYLRDKNGNRRSPGGPIDVFKPFVSVASFDVSESEMLLAVKGDSNSFTRTTTTPSDGFTNVDVAIGKRVVAGGLVEGSIFEVGIVEGYAASLDTLKGIRDRLAVNWGV